MSKQLVTQYYAKLDKILQYGGSKNEASIRGAFQNLLGAYANKQHLELIPELSVKTPRGTSVIPDGTIKNALRIDYGYWESKDTSDDIDDEIRKKLNKGYPTSNILFEDTQTAVLIQQNQEIMRVPMRDAVKLDGLLAQFISYEHPEVRSFNEAIEKFKQDIPNLVTALNNMIGEQSRTNRKFQEAIGDFHEICKTAINPDITIADIREMLIQHILTEEIFISIFSDAQFHHENNIAKELNKVEQTFFVGKTKRQTLDSIKNYYEMIKAHATGIVSHHEKQKFLKVIYENFYKAYNPKGADKLGIVYTPNEIVNFIIESTDFLLHRHFNKTLADRNVEILDPATGTGTFICDLIEYLPKQHLKYKYVNEIHANEVAILPYYIANLNIEYTFKQKMDFYEEFKNICFVDTLDNIDALDYEGKMGSLFGFSNENAERIKSQNRKKISVIIGNPPYNANQMNENENNKNREYKAVDRRIKDTYIKESTAQKTKLYDMYSRFFRWASDRVDKNGIIAFISNRSYIDSRTFDGFRKCIEDEFSHCYIVDTRSDVRTNPKIAGTTHNVFGIQTGVSVMFLIRKSDKSGKCNISYFTLADEQRKEEKLEWFRNTKLRAIPFAHIQPDDKHNWINLADTDFDCLIQLTQASPKPQSESEQGIFRFFTNAIKTNRNEWVYDFDAPNLESKMKYFIAVYNEDIHKCQGLSKGNDLNQGINYSIKWSRDLKNKLIAKKSAKYDKADILQSIFRPYVKVYYYSNKIFSDVLTENHFQMFGIKLQKANRVINFSDPRSNAPFSMFSTKGAVDYDCVGHTVCLPIVCYTSEGDSVDNITDWGLEQFRAHYKEKKITREDIFHYVYAVLHNPAYRKKYELNLKREFPRVPFYGDFKAWRNWGKALMELHINYETAKPYALKRIEEDVESPKPKLKADKESGSIIVDEQTTLKGVPKSAWDYRLGNRSALEWVLEQYKESKPRDATIAEKFNTYRFADYKEQVIELLKRVCTVSVETMKIIEKMGRA